MEGEKEEEKEEKEEAEKDGGEMRRKDSTTQNSHKGKESGRK